MGFTMASLLLHDERIPRAARDALEAAKEGPTARRREHLWSAARILHREAGVPCEDACELVGLQPGTCPE
jgi:hypothetical protein